MQSLGLDARIFTSDEEELQVAENEDEMMETAQKLGLDTDLKLSRDNDDK